ncbi:DUF945 domain-containing protein, partial [Klebsiella pneumoniae]|uniref:DUF945 domain-containing protein n=3 Tax=Klebsiella pneumoniae TaxID=573 RepID=UPI00216B465C
MRLASRFGLTHSIRQERPLTNDELVKVVPSVFSEEKHNSRSDRYTYIPTITLLDKLREEGFQPFFACQSRVRDEDKRGHTKEGANKQVISSQADSLIKISRIWADFFPANTS